MSTATNENSTETTGTASENWPRHEVKLTDVAAGKVRSLLEQEGRTDLRLRVAVQPGGCSGLIYQLYFDERLLDGDAVRDYDGVEVVVDKMSVPVPQRCQHRLRGHHLQAGLHHRQPQRRRLLRLRGFLPLRPGTVRPMPAPAAAPGKNGHGRTARTCGRKRPGSGKLYTE